MQNEKKNIAHFLNISPFLLSVGKNDEYNKLQNNNILYLSGNNIICENNLSHEDAALYASMNFHEIAEIIVQCEKFRRFAEN